MSVRDQELSKLLEKFPNAQVQNEGGHTYIRIPRAPIKVGEDIQIFQLLLCPSAHSGYETRLFLDRPVPGKGQNWKRFLILGETWHACSFRGVTADNCYLSILLCHLAHFR